MKVCRPLFSAFVPCAVLPNYLRQQYGLRHNAYTTLLSLSENGFCFHEKKGIVKPTRNEANGYRMLTLSYGMRPCNACDLI